MVIFKSLQIFRSKLSVKYFIGGMLLWAFIILLSYADKRYWFFELLSYGIPFLLFLEFTIFGLLLWRKEIMALLVLAVFGFCCTKPIKETIGFGQCLAVKPEAYPQKLRVFSFNASTFNTKRKVYDRQDSSFVDNLCAYFKTKAEQPDVLCFQEFHHDDWERKKVIEELVKTCHTKYYYMLPFWRNYQNGIFGLIILSKYPIVNKGILFSDGPYSFNKGIFVDVCYGLDTIRVINMHLQSMSIRVQDSLMATGLPAKLKNTVEKLKIGSEKRRLQVDTVEHTIRACPYPLILCGDFNSFPYGYSYQTLKKHLRNAFEESGKGFGFTLNIAPYLVRLDHQFCSQHFVPKEAKVVNEIDRSDHFPLECSYYYKSHSVEGLLSSHKVNKCGYGYQETERGP